MSDETQRNMGGRQRMNYEQMPARFGQGTLARMDGVLLPDEKRAEFVRAAVEAELRKRERRSSKAG